MKYGFGVDLGGTTVKIAWFDENGTLLHKWEIPTVTENGGSRILPDIADSVLDYCRKNTIFADDVIGLGIGVPGAVDKSGAVAACDNLGWGRTDVVKELGRLTGFSVKAGNDANVAALGEAWKGSGSDNMILITLGTGVGGGIIIDGKPLVGRTGAAGEIGHLVMERNENSVCGCGKRGCAEQYCSATGIVRLAKAYLEETGEDSLLRKSPLTCKAVFDAAAGEDSAALAILDRAYAYLGELIANICIVLNPEVVVIGGGVSKAGEPLLAGIRKHFDRFIYHASRDVEFRLAALGNDAGVYGAFKLILE